MYRTDPAACAAFPTTAPAIATLDALGLRAVVLPVRYGSLGQEFIDFIALGADRRLRFGSLPIALDRTPTLRVENDGVPEVRPPRSPEELAEAIAEAVTAMERAGANSSTTLHLRPFTLAGWDPVARRGAGGDPYRIEPVEARFGLGWLGGQPLSDEAANAAWDAVLAPFVTDDDLAAMRLFDVDAHVDYAAFDAAREAGEAGRVRRAFAAANPLLANVVLRDPVLRAAVDAGKPLRVILDAMDAGPRVRLLKAHGRRWAPKKGLLKLSRRPIPHAGAGFLQDNVVAAAETLPLDWLPVTREEAEAFGMLCWTATKAFGRQHTHQRGDWWMGAFAGASGRWQAYAQRVAAAAGHPTEDAPGTLFRLLELQREVDALDHFVADVIVPVALAHGTGELLALVGRRNRPSLPYPNCAFLGFAFEAFRAGMALPALADACRRHREALPGIRKVIAAHPPREGRRDHTVMMRRRHELCALPDGRTLVVREVRVGDREFDQHGRLIGGGYGLREAVFHADEPTQAWVLCYYADDQEAVPAPEEVVPLAMKRWGSPEALLDALTDGAGIPALGLHPALVGSQSPYDAGAPGAVEAMLDAWRRVLPRRWRKLDAKGLAAALDAEASAFAATLP